MSGVDSIPDSDITKINNTYSKCTS